MHLRRLTLDHNQVQALDPAPTLPSLETLSAAHNQLRSINLASMHESHLRHLDLSNNQLVGLHGLKTTPHLRTLNLESNDLLALDLPGCIPRLRLLNVNHNRRLRILDVQSQSRLRTLFADSCALRGPEYVANLGRAVQLETLSMKSMVQGMISWPRGIPPSLKRLFLSGSTWVEYPSNGDASVSNDRTTSGTLIAEPEVPRGSTPLPQLVYLDLSHTQLTQVPWWLATLCPVLRHADFSHNPLRTHDDLEALAYCARLKRLDLSWCAINRTSEIVRTLDQTRIEMLDTRGNPCTARLYQLPAPPLLIGADTSTTSAGVVSGEEQATAATQADANWRRTRPWNVDFVHARALHRGSLAMGCSFLRVLDRLWVADDEVVMARRLLGYDLEEE